MPRAYSNLFPALTRFANLHAAYKKAARGKRGQPQAAGFEMNLETNLFRLQDELRSGRYRPGAYHSFYIRDPKHRLVSAAPFRDRVVVSIASSRWPAIPVISAMRDGVIDLCQRSPFRVATAGGAAAGRIAKRPRVPPVPGAARGLSPIVWC